MSNSISVSALAAGIEGAWETRDEITPKTDDVRRAAIEEALRRLDQGVVRVAERQANGDWHVNQWAKQAVLLGFRLKGNQVEHFARSQDQWWSISNPYGFDKVDLKFTGWSEDQFRKAGFRMVSGAIVRKSAYIAPGVVLMPSFVNLGAYVDEGAMIDTWATVGACAQIGKNVHLSGGAGIGGVLEPMQANPVIIEDNCFIGARSEVVEGVIVREGAVLSMGVLIGKNTPIVDRTNGGKIIYGEVPSRAVVMMGLHPKNNLICPQIVKYRDEGTDAATALNELLRD